MTDDTESLPRYYSNHLNLALSGFDVTLTFMQHDPTVLPDGQEGPHVATIKSVAQVVLPVGHAKSIIPLLVKIIAKYESLYGELPAPGFEETAKD